MARGIVSRTRDFNFTHEGDKGAPYVTELVNFRIRSDIYGSAGGLGGGGGGVSRD